MKLRTLSIFTAFLFVISIYVFTDKYKRGVDLIAGSDYIKGLDVAKIDKISLTFNNKKKIVLTRDSHKFVIENHKSYPASTDKVNDLIYKIASIQIKDKVTSYANDIDKEKYEVNPQKRKYFVEMFDNNDKKIVSFSVGKTYKGKGNYLYKEGKKEIYLSQDGLWLNSSYKDFIDSVVLEVKKDEIAKLTLSTDNNLEITKKGNEFVFESLEQKKIKKENVEEFVRNLSKITFDDFYSITTPKAQALNFNRDIKIELKNKLIYKLSLAKEDKDHFLKVSALLEDTPNRFVISKQDSKEELQKIDDVIQAQSHAQRVNMEKGAWVYKVDKTIYEKLAKDSTYFL